MAKRLVLFNHKGGVSKTTSAYNIGWMLSKNHKVLLVDADPQCNLTGLLLRDDFEEYFFDDATREQNIKDGVAATFEGRPEVIHPVTCFSPARAPNLYLLAGHANLSEYDAALTFAQTANNAIATLQNLPGAFAELLRLTEEKYSIDYTIIDLNPGLTAINQNFFLLADAFVVPTNPDPFSLMALKTLSAILPRWASWKRNALGAFASAAYPLTPGIPKFVGSLIQRFNIRNGRAAKPYRDNINEINTEIGSRFLAALAQSQMTLTPAEYGNLRTENYCLGQIPDFQGLLPKSHDAGVPIFELRKAEIGETGPVLTNLEAKRDQFKKQFTEICTTIERELSHV